MLEMVQQLQPLLLMSYLSKRIEALFLFRKGFHAVEFVGAHPIALKRGMDKALILVLDFLKEIAIPISTE
jgi:chaperonin GroEL (HSP60 family)